MQDRKQKLLKKAFEIPEPERKQEFLKKLRREFPEESLGYGQFIISQAAYIRKRVWVLSGLIFMAVTAGAYFMERDMLPVISAMLPFAAMSVVTETSRSMVYEMEELELASRFSLRSVVLARLLNIGFAHLILLYFVILLSDKNHAGTLFQSGIYLLVPYLMTTFLCLYLARKIHAKEAVYACAGAAVLMSGLMAVIANTAVFLYQEIYFGKWFFVFLISLLFTVAEGRKTMSETEEIAWSLS